MSRADLEVMEKIAIGLQRDARDGTAAVIRTAISELTALRAALDAAEKRGKVLAEECRASRTFDRHNAKPIHRDNYERMIAAQTRLMEARLATDENGGLGT